MILKEFHAIWEAFSLFHISLSCSVPVICASECKSVNSGDRTRACRELLESAPKFDAHEWEMWRAYAHRPDSWKERSFWCNAFFCALFKCRRSSWSAGASPPDALDFSLEIPFFPVNFMNLWHLICQSLVDYRLTYMCNPLWSFVISRILGQWKQSLKTLEWAVVVLVCRTGLLSGSWPCRRRWWWLEFDRWPPRACALPKTMLHNMHTWFITQRVAFLSISGSCLVSSSGAAAVLSRDPDPLTETESVDMMRCRLRRLLMDFFLSKINILFFFQNFTKNLHEPARPYGIM